MTIRWPLVEFGMCVHEIQFPCEHFTVIYTFIAILHWGFCATAKYPDGIARGGVMVSETHQGWTNALRPFTRCRLVPQWKPYPVGTVKRHASSAVQCTMVFQENSFWRKGRNWHTVYSAVPTSVCLSMVHVVRICRCVCPVVPRGYPGYDRTPVQSVSIYPFYRRCAADQCTWTCDDLQLYDNSGSTQTSNTWAKKTRVYNRLDAEPINTPFPTWAIIACYRMLCDSLVSCIKDLCLCFICINNKITGHCD